MVEDGLTMEFDRIVIQKQKQTPLQDTLCLQARKSYGLYRHEYLGNHITWCEIPLVFPLWKECRDGSRCGHFDRL
jgi:hypothetical protein